MRTPIAISPTRYASIRIRRRSRRCCGRLVLAKWRSLICPPAWSLSIAAYVFDRMIDSEVPAMSNWLLDIGILVLGGIIAATDVEARCLGGGRNMGAQRCVTAPPAQTPAKPAQQAQGAQQGGQQAAPASTGSRWAGILGGLAIGGLLGYMFGGSGLLGILMIAALVILAV